MATETIDKELILMHALAAANMARDKVGVPHVDHLYPGIPGDELACAITNTVYDDDLDRKHYYVETSGAVKVYKKRLPDDGPEDDWDIEMPALADIPLNEYTTKFIELFDKGEFPELVSKPEVLD